MSDLDATTLVEPGELAWATETRNVLVHGAHRESGEPSALAAELGGLISVAPYGFLDGQPRQTHPPCCAVHTRRAHRPESERLKRCLNQDQDGGDRGRGPPLQVQSTPWAGTGAPKPHNSSDCWCPACRSWMGIYESNPLFEIARAEGATQPADVHPREQKWRDRRFSDRLGEAEELVARLRGDLDLVYSELQQLKLGPVDRSAIKAVEDRLSKLLDMSDAPRSSQENVAPLAEPGRGTPQGT